MATRIRFYLRAARHPSVGSYVLTWFCAAMDRNRQRYRLAELDDRLLKDIGLTASQAREEYGKPFWQSSHSK